MLKFYQKLDRNQRYLVAVSGGSDSMFLLDNLAQNGFNIFVVHVNYQKRQDSDRDQTIVTDYCDRKQIKYTILKVNPERYTKQNFQAQARKIRYDFFLKVAANEKINYLIVAHHFNDLLETYWLQKQRQSVVTYYGLPAQRKMQQLMILRPMLKIKKALILKYLITKKVPFQNDITNTWDIYQRNVIRKQINNLSLVAVKQLVKEIKEKNHQLKMDQQKIRNLLVNLKTNDKINYKSFLKLESDLQNKVIYQYLLEIDNELITKNYVKKILNFIITTKKANLYIKLNDQWAFVKEYNLIAIKKHFIKRQYCYIVNELQNFETPEIKLLINKKNKNYQGFFVSAKDFPIYIKNNELTATIKTKIGTKKINRLFIDNKIPLEQRLNWPVIYNCHKKIIAVPMLAVANDYLKDKNNWFMIK